MRALTRHALFWPGLTLLLLVGLNGLLNPGFLSLFVGTGAVGAVVAAISLTDPREPEAILRIAGAALYLIGTLVVTGVRNVPRNDALAKLDPAQPESAAAWTTFVREWSTWNTVRTAAAAAAAAAFTIALALE